MINKLFGALLCLVMVSGAFASVTFDQQGSVTEMVEQLKNTSPDADIVPLPGDPKAPANWTVMVYVNAKNNLESYGLKDVNEMEMIGSTPEVNIVAELGRLPGYSSSDGNWTGSRRYLIQKDDNTSSITSPVLLEIPNSDMGNWENVVEFVKWSQERYPAKHYALIIWNHGSGWNKEAETAGKGISYDDVTHHHITTAQLRLMLEATGKLDIFSMDACLMQMMEVAYEVRNGVDYVVASEETEPGDGYTYDTFLGPLVKEPGMDAAKLSATMVDSFTDHYQSVGQGGTQSSVKAGALGKLAGMIDGFVEAVMATGDTAAAKNARTKAQDFYYSSNKDLYHFVQLVVEGSSDEAVKAKGGEILKFMKDEVIVHNRATGYSNANAYGLAVYLPSYYSSSYDGLLWAQDTKWDDFMKWIK